MRKLLTLLSLCFLLAAPAAFAQDTLKIGFGGALLGNLATYGLSNLYGIEYAVYDVNSKGGVLGRQVELISEDDSCLPDQAAIAATKLSSQGIKFVLGHTCSGPTNSALSVYGNNVIVISSSATDIHLTEDGNYPFFFRTTPRDDAQSSIMVKLIKKNGYKKVAILHDKGDYGKTLAELSEAALKADTESGIEVVMVEGITSGQVSYDAIVSKVKNSGAEAIIWGGYYNDASKLAINMRDKSMDTVIIGADGLYDDRFLSIGGQAVEGSYATGQSDISSSAAAQAALTYHKAHHTEETGTYFFYAIGAAQALFSAIEKAGTADDLELIKKHLTEDTVDTAMGPVRFDSKGDIIGAGFTLYQIQNGKFVVVDLE
ncbi:MAG: branched-chain amino acid ABC transporter substrate-binding protein [Deltaproteobacteria bacterium]|jgi:branched-chain amino acid transport system substrate-binding protein|nr:branched-chain amino acid ABC transporter substrate-binding protein [Deltaproteobacteria bacterium]